MVANVRCFRCLLNSSYSPRNGRATLARGNMTRTTQYGQLLLPGLVAGTALPANHDVVRAQQSAKPPVLTEFWSKLALDGYDPVAYFKIGKTTKGSADHTVVWNGATSHFSSAQHKAAFEASP